MELEQQLVRLRLLRLPGPHGQCWRDQAPLPLLDARYRPGARRRRETSLAAARWRRGELAPLRLNDVQVRQADPAAAGGISVLVANQPWQAARKNRSAAIRAPALDGANECKCKCKCKQLWGKQAD
jgi:hypothetical protein